MRFRFVCLVAFVLIFGFALPQGNWQYSNLPFGVSATLAQERKSLLRRFFDRVKKKNAERRKKAAARKANRAKARAARRKGAGASNRKNSRTGNARRRSTNSGNAQAARRIVAVEKSPDAVPILIAGDFMAGNLANGLKAMFAKNPDVKIENIANARSGLIRTDVVDWPFMLGEQIDRAKPIAVVIMVGMNDRQDINLPDQRLDRRAPEWQTEYQKRTENLALAVRNKRIPMIWVGLPPAARRSMSNDYQNFNELYKASAEKYGGLYVDIWDGFASQSGQYVRRGPDVNGQITTLRTGDGINMTRNGSNKLGFYAEKAIKRLTGFGHGFQADDLGDDDGSSQNDDYDPIASGRTIAIALGSPSADGSAVLEGAQGIIVTSDARLSNSFDLVRRGQSVRPKKGRVDAAWGEPSYVSGGSEMPEPMLANYRGMVLRSFLDEVVELPQKDEAASDNKADANN